MKEILTRGLSIRFLPIIFLTAHYSNWLLGILAIGATYMPISIVGRPLDWKWLNQILTQTREQFGIKVISILSSL